MSSLRDKLKKLSFFTHYPKKHETLTINSNTEEFSSKEEMWNEWSSSVYINGKWLLNEPYTALKFTSTTLSQYQSNTLIGSNIIIDYGDGNVVTYEGDYSHTYTTNGNYTIKIYGVTGLGNNCFRSCTGLTSINIPSSVTSLGTSCFNSCTGLTSIVIPSSVTSLGNYCFKDCTGLTSIILNWDTNDEIITYKQNWITDANSNLKFIIPTGTTSLYTAKNYPLDKLQEQT